MDQRETTAVQYNIEHENGWCYPVNCKGEVSADTAAGAKEELEKRWVSGSVVRVQVVKFEGEYTGWY